MHKLRGLLPRNFHGFNFPQVFSLQFSTSLWSLVFQKIKVGITKQRELHILTFWTNAIIYQVFVFVFIQSSFILIGVPAGVFAVYSFFHWVKFSFPLATCKLTWYLTFLTGGDILTDTQSSFHKNFHIL